MDDHDQAVFVRQMTAFFLAVATVFEGVMRASNTDRAAVLVFVNKTIDEIPAEQRAELLVTLLKYWAQIVERGPGAVRPPVLNQSDKKSWGNRASVQAAAYAQRWLMRGPTPEGQWSQNLTEAF